MLAYSLQVYGNPGKKPFPHNSGQARPTKGVDMKFLAALLAALCLIPSAPVSSAAAAEEVNLSFALIIPPVHNRWVKGLEPWIKELEARSSGRITIEPYFAESLSKMADIMDSVRVGVADIGESNFNVGIGRFPFHEQLMNQALPSHHIGNPLPIRQGMHEAFPEAATVDTKGVKLLFLSAQTVGAMIGTKDKPVKSLADLKGLKIGVSGGGTRLERLSDFGATVVGMSVPDMYMSLEKGVVDGACVDFEVLVSRRLGDVIKHVTFVSTGTIVFYCVMNQDVYDALPDDLRAVLDDVSTRAAAEIFQKYWSETQIDCFRKWQNEMGGKAYVLSESDYAELDRLAEKASDNWVDFLNSKGLPGEAMLKKFRELEKMYAQPWPTADFLQYVKN